MIRHRAHRLMADAVPSGTDDSGSSPGDHPGHDLRPLTDEVGGPVHIHPSQRSHAGTIRAARVRWCDDGGEPEPMIRILIRNRPIQTLTHNQALRLANQIADLIQREKEEK
jgi:hypothetical protein